MKAADILSAEGSLAGAIGQFEEREGQQMMAKAVENAIQNQRCLVVEAGTGTGKTFAYLTPALQTHGKTVISTGSKALQDQLFHRDIPQLMTALKADKKVALLKGRSNYLCDHRLQTAHEHPLLLHRRSSGMLAQINSWAGRTQHGDIAELETIPEDWLGWQAVTSNNDNCLGADCPSFKGCHVMAARRNALAADIVVVNHHLLFADLVLKDEGFGELLPTADVIIVDEAHQLPDVAIQFFGVSFSSRQCLELSRDANAELINLGGDDPLLSQKLTTVENRAKDCILLLAECRRAVWSEVNHDVRKIDSLSALLGALNVAREALMLVADRDPGLERCLERAVALQQRLGSYLEEDDGTEMRWIDSGTKGFRLHKTPLNIAEKMQTTAFKLPAPWVFASATLAVGDKFDHYSKALGMPDNTDALIAPSPFDYQKNAMLFLPKNMPWPGSEQHTDAMVTQLLPLIEKIDGGAFLLFTSHRALRYAADLLATRTKRLLLVQGTAPRSHLVDKFRESGQAILLGAHSFWEGVDVPGKALSFVAIDKLPFSPPNDPINRAREQAIREAGGHPFTDDQLPRAVLSLKQGVGRLIRSQKDRGVLVICDPRISQKSYGKVFLNSLPEMPRSSEYNDVLAFILAMDTAA